MCPVPIVLLVPLLLTPLFNPVAFAREHERAISKSLPRWKKAIERRGCHAANECLRFRAVPLARPVSCLQLAAKLGQSFFRSEDPCLCFCLFATTTFPRKIQAINCIVAIILSDEI